MRWIYDDSKSSIIYLRNTGYRWHCRSSCLCGETVQNIPEHIREKLSNAADAIEVLDREMSEVRNEIMDAQNARQIQSNIVTEILMTIQNLYAIANRRDVAKIQDEFYEVYQEDNLEKLIRFHKNLDIIAEGYKAQGIEFKV